ncbi:arsenate reductase (glutaredoxin) [Thioclava sp. GXIMD4215]|uniref:arsenate reductase (glutaredoxin) n=1 Tax=Thioclava sp. GXIMD4215 TaxID=3131928 RepID=UPI003246CDBE
MALILWHNPRCSKSRETLALLQARGITPELRLYLNDPPSRAELETLVDKLDQPARALIRWKEAKDSLDATASAEEILDHLARTPKLIERPILIHDTAARIGRPPEQVLEIL